MPHRYTKVGGRRNGENGFTFEQLSDALMEISPNAVHIHKTTPLFLELRRKGVPEQGKETHAEFTENELDALLDEIEKMHEGQPQNPYHNIPHTFDGVVPRTKELLEQMEPPLSTSEQQAMVIAAAFHDYGHIGRTDRTDTEGYSAEAAAAVQAEGGLSNEQIAAIAADHFAQEKGFSIRQRIFIYGLIIGTTFGNPTIKAKTIPEKLLSSADRAGYAADAITWLKESAGVEEEKKPSARYHSIEAWLAGQKIFLEKYAVIEDAPKIVEETWGEQLREKITLITTIQAHLQSHDITTPHKDPNIQVAIETIQRIITPLLKKESPTQHISAY